MNYGVGIIMLTCKNATKLISKSQEKPLALKERISLRFHLLICSGCKHYNKQMSFIRQACDHISGNDK